MLVLFTQYGKMTTTMHEVDDFDDTLYFIVVAVALPSATVVNRSTDQRVVAISQVPTHKAPVILYLHMYVSM